MQNRQLAVNYKVNHCLKFSIVKDVAYKNQCNWTPLLYNFKTFVYRNMGSLHILVVVFFNLKLYLKSFK